MTSDIFAVIISSDNETGLKDKAVYFTAETEGKIDLLLGNPLRTIELFTGLANIRGTKPSEIEKCFESSLSIFEQKNLPRQATM